jgi:tetratricopeptide (TPR) repeat protein
MCEQLGEYEKAIAYLQKTLAGDCSDKQVRRLATLGIARNLRQQGKCREEIDYLKTVVDEDSENRLEAILWVGEESCDLLQDYSSGLAAFRQVVDEIPSDEEVTADGSGTLLHVVREAQMRIGLVTLWQLHQPSEARTYFEDLLETGRHTDEVEIRHSLAQCIYEENNWSAARDAFQSLYDADPTRSFQASCLFMVAECSSRLGDVERANSAYEAVITDFPDDSLAAEADSRLKQLHSSQQSGLEVFMAFLEPDRKEPLGWLTDVPVCWNF